MSKLLNWNTHSYKCNDRWVCLLLFKAVGITVKLCIKQAHTLIQLPRCRLSWLELAACCNWFYLCHQICKKESYTIFNFSTLMLYNLHCVIQIYCSPGKLHMPMCAMQGWTRVGITGPDDPLTRIVMWVRPGFDLDVTRFN